MTIVARDELKAAAKIALYRQDFERFARDELKVKPKQTGDTPVGSPIQPLRLNAPQRTVNAIAEAQLRTQGFIRLACLKARQPGLSTWAEGRGFHMAALNPNVHSLVIAQDDATAAHIFGITKLFYDCLSPAVKPLTRYSSKAELVFENPNERTRPRSPGLRSRITFQTAKNIHAGTGQSLQVGHFSEMAKWVDAQTVMASVGPSIQLAPGTSMIMESTAFPTGDWFRDFYEHAKRDRGPWRAVFLPWFLSPEYAIPLAPGEVLHADVDERHLVATYGLTPAQLKFRRYKIEEGGGDTIAAELFKQEYPADDAEAWITTQMAVFEARKLHAMRAQVRPPVITGDVVAGARLLEDPSGPLAIWQVPEAGRLYDIGADVATGIEDGDWSVAEVIDRATREQVAEYRAHISPLDFASALYQLGRYYNTAQVGVEITGIGFATNEKLNQMGYPCCYIWRKRGHAVPTLSSFSGWETSWQSKKLMVSLTRHLLMRDEVRVHSPILLNEMRAFSRVALGDSGNEGYRGAPGYHDDTVMAFMIALVIADDETFGVAALLDRPAAPASLSLDERLRRASRAFRDDPEPAGRGDWLVDVARERQGWR